MVRIIDFVQILELQGVSRRFHWSPEPRFCLLRTLRQKCFLWTIELRRQRARNFWMRRMSTNRTDASSIIVVPRDGFVDGPQQEVHVVLVIVVPQGAC